MKKLSVLLIAVSAMFMISCGGEEKAADNLLNEYSEATTALTDASSSVESLKDSDVLEDIADFFEGVVDAIEDAYDDVVDAIEDALDL